MINKQSKTPELIVALDLPSLDEALSVAGRLIPEVDFFKIGLQLFIAEGPTIIRKLKGLGCRVFLDLKLHDIPNQVSSAVVEAVKMGADMLTIHTLGGRDMMIAAAQAASDFARLPITELPILLGVTVLTSHDQRSLAMIGLNDGIDSQVLRLAKLAKEAGLSGVVASGRETALLRQQLGSGFLLVVPGIRPIAGVVDDQKRTVTPMAAIKAGADYLVVGRPIIDAPDPIEAARLIKGEMVKG